MQIRKKKEKMKQLVWFGFLGISAATCAAVPRGRCTLAQNHQAAKKNKIFHDKKKLIVPQDNFGPL